MFIEHLQTFWNRKPAWYCSHPYEFRGKCKTKVKYENETVQATTPSSPQFVFFLSFCLPTLKKITMKLLHYCKQAFRHHLTQKEIQQIVDQTKRRWNSLLLDSRLIVSLLVFICMPAIRYLGSNHPKMKTPSLKQRWKRFIGSRKDMKIYLM